MERTELCRTCSLDRFSLVYLILYSRFLFYAYYCFLVGSTTAVKAMTSDVICANKLGTCFFFFILLRSAAYTLVFIYAYRPARPRILHYNFCTKHRCSMSWLLNAKITESVPPPLHRFERFFLCPWWEIIRNANLFTAAGSWSNPWMNEGACWYCSSSSSNDEKAALIGLIGKSTRKCFAWWHSRQ